MTDCREKAHFHVPHRPTRRPTNDRALLTAQVAKMRLLTGASLARGALATE